jgi:hypothetical protein
MVSVQRSTEYDTEITIVGGIYCNKRWSHSERCALTFEILSFAQNDTF